jgi:hypothetical protein
MVKTGVGPEVLDHLLSDVLILVCWILRSAVVLL